MNMEQSEQMRQESRPEEIEKQENFSVFRGRIIKSLLIGTMAILEACGGLKPEEIEKMPSSQLENVIEHPDQFKEMPLIKVEGYPESAGQDTFETPIPQFDTKGGFQGMSWITSTMDKYRIHETPDIKSRSLDAIRNGGMTYMPATPLAPSAKSFEAHRYGFVGKLKQIKEGGQEKWVLHIEGEVDEGNK